MTVKEYYVLNSDIKSGNDKIEIYVRGSNSEFGNYIARASYFDLLKWVQPIQLFVVFSNNKVCLEETYIVKDRFLTTY